MILEYIPHTHSNSSVVLLQAAFVSLYITFTVTYLSLIHMTFDIGIYCNDSKMVLRNITDFSLSL